MWSSRRMLWIASAVVLLAAISLVTVTLYQHRSAALALEQRGGNLVYGEPPFGESLELEWYTKLFGTVEYAHLGSTEMTVGDAANLRRLRGLKMVLFRGGSDSAWLLLPTNLTHIYITQDGTALSPVAWVQLGRMRYLESLYIHGVDENPVRPPSSKNEPWEIDSALLKAITNMPKLHEIGLRDVKVPRGILRDLLTQTPGLDSLDLSGVPDLKEEDLLLISRHPGIRHLGLLENSTLTSGTFRG